ncbi:MAG TPA: GIY-YIG nuclease family protein, partial [Alphaproteobacteria bacterium]|nr:GIY-YIG nuclease family protein [Alphaproteobacteria bacterium]
MLAIETYGLRWSRDKIYWGAGSNKGHLKGRLKGKRSTIVDFRDQIGIYVLFDPNGRVVYIGQAGTGDKGLFGRLRDHRKDHLRDRWTS